jgi:hypothetical protein
VFLRGPCRGVILKPTGATQSVLYGGCEERTSAREAEESPLIEAVARERLKTQKAGKGLAGAMVICELWRLAVAL